MCVNKPVISIIIPTHNRADALSSALAALASQTYSKSQFEVIVVADGCTDKTVEMVKGYKAPYKLQILEQKGCGAAAARNEGAANAVGSLLVFLDDDITASSYLVEAHLKAHQQAPDRVVIGNLSTVLKEPKGFFHLKLKGWWDDVFYPMHFISYRFSFRNLLSGNFSLPAQLFNFVGGFNTSFKCQEDYELGMRLIQSHAQFIFEPEALGYHNETTDLNRWLCRKYSEGRAAVQFCHNHPQLFDALPLFDLFKNGISSPYFRVLYFIHRWPTLAYCKAMIYRYALDVLERLGMPGLWEKLLGRLQGYWYLKGILDSVDSPDSLRSLLKELSCIQKQSSSVTEIDLAKGIEAAEQKLNELRPLSVKLYYSNHFIGHIATKAGFERLRGIHLRSMLEQEFSYSLSQAIELEKAVSQPIDQ